VPLRIDCGLIERNPNSEHLRLGDGGVIISLIAVFLIAAIIIVARY
jgi:hypothetical protein